jgi:hypothetical protein
MIAKILYLVPKEGVTVRDPHTRRKLPPEGEPHRVATQSEATYWSRRIRDRSVVIGEPPVKPVLATDAERLAADVKAGASADVIAADVARVQGDKPTGGAKQ